MGTKLDKQSRVRKRTREKGDEFGNVERVPSKATAAVGDQKKENH